MTDDITRVGFPRFSRPIGLLHTRIADRPHLSGILVPFTGVLSRRQGSDAPAPVAFSYLGPQLFVLGPFFEEERSKAHERPERVSPGRSVVERVTHLTLPSSPPTSGAPTTPSGTGDPRQKPPSPAIVTLATGAPGESATGPHKRPSVSDRPVAASVRTVLSPPFVPAVERLGVDRPEATATETGARSESSSPVARIDQTVRSARVPMAGTGAERRTGERPESSGTRPGWLVLARSGTAVSDSSSTTETLAADATARGRSRRATPDGPTDQASGDEWDGGDRPTPPTRLVAHSEMRTTQIGGERTIGWKLPPLVTRRPLQASDRADVSGADPPRDRERPAASATPIERSVIEPRWTVLSGESGEAEADRAEADRAQGTSHTPADRSRVGLARLEVRSLGDFGHRSQVARTRGPDTSAGAPQEIPLWGDGPRMSVRRTPSAETQQAASGTGERAKQERRQPLPGATEGGVTRAGDRTDASGPVRELDVDRFADRLYRRIERKARVERERRGI